MARLSLEDVRAGVLMKARPFVALKGTPEEFEIELRPLSGDQRRDIMTLPKDDGRASLLERKAVAFATGLTEDETGSHLPAEAVTEIAFEVLARNGMRFREDAAAPKAPPPEPPAEKPEPDSTTQTEPS